MLPAELTAASEATRVAEPPSNELGREDFLRMLIAQLENQDPLNPQEATEFTAQLAQFSSLEQLISMRTAVESLAETQTQSQQLTSVGLIGREVLVESQQFEVDAAGNLPALSFELDGPAAVVSVELADRNGGVVARSTGLGIRPAGITDLPWSRFDATPPPGVYSMRVNLADATAPPATTLVESRVTGAVLDAANPLIILGQVPAALDAVREVRE